MDILKEIEKLDPLVDAQRISFLSGAYHFPEDNRIALELALFRTFGVPSIGSLLDRTQEFARRPQKRYDDTVLIMAEIIENGLNSSRGQAALARLNQIHGHFKIDNEDYLYVLSTFLFEPIRWIQRYGWRQLTPKEISAGYILWKEVGTAMGIRGIPESYEDFEVFNRAYEASNFSFNPGGRRVADATVELFLGKYPRFLRPLLNLAIYAMLDEPIRKAFAYPRAPPFVCFLVTALWRTRALVLRILPKRKQPLLRTQLPYPSYPQAHTIEGLGYDKPRR